MASLSKSVEVQAATGSLKICSVWEFVLDIKRQKLHHSVAETFSTSLRLEAIKQPQRYLLESEYGLVTKTNHILKMNPTKALTELRKTTTYRKLMRKDVDLVEVVNIFAHKAMLHGGELTHLFPIGENTYALVNKEDMMLYVTEDFHQIIVCDRHIRNYTLYIPNLKVNS